MNASEALRRRPSDPGDGHVPFGAAIGALAVFVVAAALVPFRDHLPNADMALALVLPVLLSSIVGGRLAGTVTAVVSALTFDFVFTVPYLSLRISSKDDVATFVAFFIVAIITAEVGIRSRRGGAAARESRSELDRLVRVAELSACGADVDDVVSSARAELIGLFELEECIYEPERSGPELPRLGNRGALGGRATRLVGRVPAPDGRRRSGRARSRSRARPARAVRRRRDTRRRSRSASSPSRSPTSSASPSPPSPPNPKNSTNRCRTSQSYGLRTPTTGDDWSGACSPLLKRRCLTGFLRFGRWHQYWHPSKTSFRRSTDS